MIEKILAEALAEFYPPKNPEDITTWTADELDELVLADMYINGSGEDEVDYIGLQENAPHGLNSEEDKLPEVD